VAKEAIAISTPVFSLLCHSLLLSDGSGSACLVLIAADSIKPGMTRQKIERILPEQIESGGGAYTGFNYSMCWSYESADSQSCTLSACNATRR
jgi:hypothetical protein